MDAADAAVGAVVGLDAHAVSAVKIIISAINAPEILRVDIFGSWFDVIV